MAKAYAYLIFKDVKPVAAFLDPDLRARELFRLMAQDEDQEYTWTGVAVPLLIDDTAPEER